MAINTVQFQKGMSFFEFHQQFGIEAPGFDVRRAKAVLFLWVRNPPGHFHSDRKQLGNCSHPCGSQNRP